MWNQFFFGIESRFSTLRIQGINVFCPLPSVNASESCSQLLFFLKSTLNTLDLRNPFFIDSILNTSESMNQLFLESTSILNASDLRDQLFLQSNLDSKHFIFKELLFLFYFFCRLSIVNTPEFWNQLFLELTPKSYCLWFNESVVFGCDFLSSMQISAFNYFWKEFLIFHASELKNPILLELSQMSTPLKSRNQLFSTLYPQHFRIKELIFFCRLSIVNTSKLRNQLSLESILHSQHLRIKESIVSGIDSLISMPWIWGFSCFWESVLVSSHLRIKVSIVI